jgi:hypothetical protein
MNKSIELKQINITDANQLNSLLDLIHDEHFNVEDIIYNKIDNSLTIPYRRIFHNGIRKTLLNLLIYTIKETDVIRSKLLIKNATKYEIHDPENICSYSFNDIIYKNGKLEFNCEPNLTIFIDTTKLEIESKDIEIKGKSRISYFLFFIEGNTGKIYE